jgi:hypothetical protein
MLHGRIEDNAFSLQLRVCLAVSAALMPLVISASYVAPRDDEATPRAQNKEMKTWFKIGRN